MPLPLFQVDAFTDRPYRGNPAAVCLLDAPRDDAWMQDVAREMNLSETAFLLARPDGDYDLRWFTPTTEVDLCGHATLASAHTLWAEDLAAAAAPIRFHTASGPLVCRRDGDWIEMDFPAEPVERASLPEALLEALGTPPVYVGRNRMDYLVVLQDAEAVRRLQPDLARLGAVDTRGVIVTGATEGDEVDFVSRFFAPRVGVPEDPVTGSAHCALGPYWARRCRRDTVVGHQASARGGTVRVTVDGDRVRLAGRAVLVVRGMVLAD